MAEPEFEVTQEWRSRTTLPDAAVRASGQRRCAAMRMTGSMETEPLLFISCTW